MSSLLLAAASFGSPEESASDTQASALERILHGEEGGPFADFAALYGDEAAEQLGYQRLGLPPRAGFELALSDTLARGDDPTSALLTRA